MEASGPSLMDWCPPCVCQQRKLRPVRVSQSTLSELSSYINYINLSNFFSLDYSYWETLFIICFHKVMAHEPQTLACVGATPRLEIFVGLDYQGKDIVFRFIIAYSSLRDFGPYLIGLFLYEDF